MRNLLLLITLIVLSASNCKKSQEGCHYNIKIINNSTNQIISSIVLNKENNICRLDGKLLNNGENFNYDPFNTCIENRLSNSSIIDIYIVDPLKYNSTDKYYSCDSIDYYNAILKHYELTLEDIKNNNFTIIYEK